MTIDHLLTMDATVRRRGPGTTKDRTGTPMQDAAARTVTYPCFAEQEATTEILAGRETIVADWLAWFGSQAGLDGTDRIEQIVHRGSGRFVGGPFRIVGSPAVRFRPRGAHHVEVKLLSIDA